MIEIYRINEKVLNVYDHFTNISGNMINKDNFMQYPYELIS